MSGHRAFGALLVAATACGQAPKPASSRLAIESSLPTEPVVPSANAPAPVAEPSAAVDASPIRRGDLYPAGYCGFDPYLDGPCDSAPPPTFAVVLGSFQVAMTTARRGDVSRPVYGDQAIKPSDEIRHLELALASARNLGLPVGYPFVSSYDDLPDKARKRHGFAIVAGLFSSETAAVAFVRDKGLSAHRSEIVEIAPSAEDYGACGDDYEACMAKRHTAVEILSRTPAWTSEALTKVEEALDQSSARGSASPNQRRAVALSKLQPVCEVAPGRVFSTDRRTLYAFQRTYAPITCDDGRPAWVPWRSTRLESAVVPTSSGTRIHQVVEVECDTPTIEDRPFGPQPPPIDYPVGRCPG